MTRSIARSGLIAAALLAAWLGLALLAMLPGKITTAAVPLPSPALLAALPENVAITDARPGLLIVQSSDPGFVRALYAAGARLVLPARRKTCLYISV